MVCESKREVEECRTNMELENIDGQTISQMLGLSLSLSDFFPCIAESLLMVGTRKPKNRLKAWLHKPDNREREVNVDSEKWDLSKS